MASGPELICVNAAVACARQNDDMEHGAKIAECPGAHTVRTVMIAILFGLTIMAAAVASTESHPGLRSDQPVAAASHEMAQPQPDCATPPGSSSGHCQLPAAVTINAGMGTPGPARSFDKRWILRGESRRMQHRPNGPLRPPTTFSAIA